MSVFSSPSIFVTESTIDCYHPCPYTFSMKKSWLLIAIFIILTNGILVAKKDITITSSYETEQYLQFQYGPPPVLSTFNSGDIEIYPANLCALLGTLTLWTNGNNLFDPELINISVSTSLFIEGYVRDTNTGQIVYEEQIPVTLRAITIIGGAVADSVLVENGTIDLVSGGGNVLPGQVDTLTTYIVMIAPDYGYDYYIPGVYYSLDENSSIGSFGVSADGQGQQEFEEIPVEVDGSGTATPTAPFIPSAPVPGDEVEIPFEGDGFPYEHQYAFSIISNPASFDLQDAILGNRPVIATLQLEVSLAEENTEYGVEIAFTSKDPDGFKLHLNGDLSEYEIPYQLYFGYDLEPIPHAQFIEWRNLFTSNNTFASMQETITVSIHDGENIWEAPQGQYSDTVTVNIIPLDILTP